MKYFLFFKLLISLVILLAHGCSPGGDISITMKFKNSPVSTQDTRFPETIDEKYTHLGNFIAALTPAHFQLSISRVRLLSSNENKDYIQIHDISKSFDFMTENIPIEFSGEAIQPATYNYLFLYFNYPFQFDEAYPHGSANYIEIELPEEYNSVVFDYPHPGMYQEMCDAFNPCPDACFEKTGRTLKVYDFSSLYMFGVFNCGFFGMLAGETEGYFELGNCADVIYIDQIYNIETFEGDGFTTNGVLPRVPFEPVVINNESEKIELTFFMDLENSIHIYEGATPDKKDDIIILAPKFWKGMRIEQTSL